MTTGPWLSKLVFPKTALEYGWNMGYAVTSQIDRP